MADEKLVKVLREDGAEAFNAWRKDNPGASVDLVVAELPKIDLRNVNLARANLMDANLVSAMLAHANLEGANLTGAIFHAADLRSANLTGANLTGANLMGTILETTFLTGADLTDTVLEGADLTGAILHEADLSGANLKDAKLMTADLASAPLKGANLTGADLRRAKGLTQEQIDKVRFDPGNPPALPMELKLPEQENADEEADVAAAPSDGEPGDGAAVRRAPYVHPRDRIILSNELNTPTSRARRAHSEEELIALNALLEDCVSEKSTASNQTNMLTIPMAPEDLAQLRAVIGAMIEIQRAPNYPPRIIDVLTALGDTLRAIKEAVDWTPFPPAISRRVAAAVEAYDAFLNEIGIL